MVRLEVDPELRRCSEGAGEQPGSPRSDSPLATDELIDALNRDVEMLGERDLAHTQRLQEILQEDLAGVGGDPVLRQHLYSSVIVIDLDVVGISVLPAEDDPPLVVDTDAVLPTQFS